jgi:putative tryptophan/tyrosine transport system substrate-binding protein
MPGVALTGSVLSRTSRREFLVGIAGVLACTPRSRAAQHSDPVIGVLFAGSFGPDPDQSADAFWKGLAEFGYLKGRNVSVESREAHNDVSRLPELAWDLVRRQVNVIFVPGSGPAVHAAKAATATIPIVFVNSGDPVGMGYVASLSRPGGNVTGVSDFGDQLSAKRLELIKQLVPAVSRIGILAPRRYPGLAREVEGAREVAPALSLKTVETFVVSLREIDAALAAFVQDRVEGLYFTPGPLFFTERQQIVALAARYRLPAIYSFAEFPEVGGLMSYGISVTERSYEAGRYVGLILNGANPADLPIHRLTKFELALNLSTAKALRLSVPARFLAITDQVIE